MSPNVYISHEPQATYKQMNNHLDHILQVAGLVNKGITFSLEGLLIFTPDSAHFQPERSEGRNARGKGVNNNNNDKLNVIRIIVQYLGQTEKFINE